jgi:hypothetical protein
LARGLRPALARTERIVAWASSTSDSDGESAGRPGVVVATNLGLWLPGRKDRLGWHQIHKAAWVSPVLTVVPAIEVDAVEVGAAGGYLVMADEPPVVLTLDDPGDVPVEVRTRVNRSVAHTSHHELPGGGDRVDPAGVRVVARRAAGVNGLAWHVRYDEGTDRSDPAVVEATAALFTDAPDGEHAEPPAAS